MNYVTCLKQINPTGHLYPSDNDQEVQYYGKIKEKPSDFPKRFLFSSTEDSKPLLENELV